MGSVCKHTSTTVLDSRDYGGHRHRIRKCVRCKKRIRTVEIELSEYTQGNYSQHDSVVSNLKIALVEALSLRQTELIAELLGIKRSKQ